MHALLFYMEVLVLGFCLRVCDQFHCTNIIHDMRQKHEMDQNGSISPHEL